MKYDNATEEERILNKSTATGSMAVLEYRHVEEVLYAVEIYLQDKITERFRRIRRF